MVRPPAGRPIGAPGVVFCGGAPARPGFLTVSSPLG